MSRNRRKKRADWSPAEIDKLVGIIDGTVHTLSHDKDKEGFGNRAFAIRHHGHIIETLRHCKAMLMDLHRLCEDHAALIDRMGGLGTNLERVDLVRHQAGRIKRQRTEINHLKEQLAMSEKVRRIQIDHVQTLITNRKPLDSHLAMVKKAAKKGDLLRVIALLEDWAG